MKNPKKLKKSCEFCRNIGLFSGLTRKVEIGTTGMFTLAPLHVKYLVPKGVPL